MKVILEVTQCRDCPHVTNSAREHDCAFTSAPHPTYWWCTHPNNKGVNKNFTIDDDNKIDPRCPCQKN